FLIKCEEVGVNDERIKVSAGQQHTGARPGATQQQQCRNGRRDVAILQCDVVCEAPPFLRDSKCEALPSRHSRARDAARFQTVQDWISHFN
ncbi:hypothetical protein HAX54_051920, partial [Datura stramonium]|nr:hypothetical protein [Datura stramonium]